MVSPGNGSLSFVRATGDGCLIYRDTTGCYVVNHEEAPRQRRWAATLAGAYAACQGLEPPQAGAG